MITQENTSQRPGNILPAIVLTCIFLGLLAYLATSLSETSESASGFLQVAVALAAMAYLLTFVDIRLGLGLMILCIGLSPEVEVGGFKNLRLEDFLVPALLLAWILRSTRSREDVVSNPIAAPLWSYLGVGLLAGLWGVSMETVQLETVALIIGKNLIFVLIFMLILNHIRSYQEFRAF
ncbi:MAG: hypothetical protein QF645_08850, partial [Planctomycetota bacterium]|nr:hypothetical protein [Planctomycetota bacterium]